VINVAAGTYDEVLDITRDVAIHGAGSGTTKIAPTSLPTQIVGVRGATTEAEIDGFTIRYPTGFYQPGYPSVQSIGVHVWEGATANVHDNVITEIHNENSNGNQTGHCVMIGMNGATPSSGTITLNNNTITYCGKQGVTARAGSNVTITNNVIAHGNKGDGKDPAQGQATNGVVLYPGDSSIVSGNEIFDWVCDETILPVCEKTLNGTQSIGLLVFGAQTSLSVTDNDFHDTDAGYFDYQAGAGPFSFSGNTFEDNLVFNAAIYGAGETWSNNSLDGSQYGLLLYGDTTPVNLNLLGGNTINGASVQGVLTDTSGGVVNISGSKNKFSDNAAGIDTSGATTADLKCNWWGAASGPTVGSNPGGTGDPASSNAIYAPFSTNDDTFDCGPVNPTLAFGAGSIEEGSSTTLTLTLTNDNADPITNVGTTVNLPSGFVATGVESNECGATVDLSNPAAPVVSGVSLGPDADCTVVFTVIANTAGQFSVDIPAGGVISPNGNSVNAAAAVLLVTAKVNPNPPNPPTPPTPPVDPLPACFKDRLILTDVALFGNRVTIRGFAHIVDAGNTVTVRSLLTGRIVARPKVAADGSWSANVAAPPRRLRSSNKARYRAQLGNTRTIWTKLTRRMQSTKVTYLNGRLQVVGSASLPLAPRASAAVSASYNCGSYRNLGRIRVTSRGGYSGSVATKVNTTVALVRVRVSVRNSNGLIYSTYSIIQPVVLSNP
jgi:hypothetical protein